MRERYTDFGPTLACEKLDECHGLCLMYKTGQFYFLPAAGASHQKQSFQRRIAANTSVSVGSGLWQRKKGLVAGSVTESPIPLRPAFANHYERSKWEAETCLIKQFPDLPWEIVRMPTAISDDATGTISQFNAFHNTLKLCYYGLLSLLPGKPDTPVYLVSAEFVAKVVVALTSPSGQPAGSPCQP